MNLNVLLRGQSNAYMLGAMNGGAQAMVDRVEALLGFDGVNDTVTLEFAGEQPGGNTAYSGTAFLTQWLNKAGGGWQVAGLEQGLLDYVNALPAAQKAEPTAVIWLHSEYDSGYGDLTAAEWASAVRYDAALVRATFGQPAAALPYLFVSAIPYGQGTDSGHQAIRVGMEALAADPAFNARIAARALDTDMSFDNPDQNSWTVEYGGAHMSYPDGWQTANRLALALAEQWAAYAKPGSAVALAGGQLDDHGPQVVAASQVSRNQLALTVAFDAASSLQPLDPDAARGVGWTVIGEGGTSHAVAATLTGPAGLLLTFDQPLPAGGLLHYGWGYGRLAGADGAGQGNAVYDDHGQPIWVGATGLPYGSAVVGTAAAAPPNGSGGPAGLFGSLGGWDAASLVWSGSASYGGTSYHAYTASAVWGGVEWARLAPTAWEPGWSDHQAVDNIPTVDIDLHAAGTKPLDLLLLGSRGGNVGLGDGANALTWVARSDAADQGGTLVATTGTGDDRMVITAVGLSPLAADLVRGGQLYDPGYDGRYSVAELHLGGGSDSISVAGATRLLVFGGDSRAEITGGSGADIVQVGAGGGRFSGGGGADNWIFAPGIGSASILDFHPGEDWLTFTGIAPGAITAVAAEQGGVAGTLLTFDAAGHAVFLAGVTDPGNGLMMFA